jgi:ADP-ribose pyrophosphatase
MAAGEWEVVEAETVGDFEVFRVRRQRVRSPRNGDVYTFHVMECGPSVIVIAVTAAREFVLVEQFRQAVRKRVLEFPAGLVDAGEDPVEAGLRELEEETGYRAGSARVLGAFHTDPAVQDSFVTVVLAEECERDGETDQDESEDVGVRVVAIDAVGDMILRGDFPSAPALAAWALYRQCTR